MQPLPLSRGNRWGLVCFVVRVDAGRMAPSRFSAFWPARSGTSR